MSEANICLFVELAKISLLDLSEGMKLHIWIIKTAFMTLIPMTRGYTALKLDEGL